MRTPEQQIEELEYFISQAKNPNDVLVKNWKRSINLLNTKIQCTTTQTTSQVKN